MICVFFAKSNIIHIRTQHIKNDTIPYYARKKQREPMLARTTTRRRDKNKNEPNACVHKACQFIGVTGTCTLHYYVDKKRCIWISVCVAFWWYHFTLTYIIVWPWTHTHKHAFDIKTRAVCVKKKVFLFLFDSLLLTSCRVPHGL